MESDHLIVETKEAENLPLITSAPLTAASNSYMVKVGGQSTILSPGSSTHLEDQQKKENSPNQTNKN